MNIYLTQHNTTVSFRFQSPSPEFATITCIYTMLSIVDARHNSYFPVKFVVSLNIFVRDCSGRVVYTMLVRDVAHLIKLKNNKNRYLQNWPKIHGRIRIPTTGLSLNPA